MPTLRLTSIDLTYGCHSGHFDLPASSEPIVIYGSNGAGKTTLMEALVMTLYGFDLKKESRRLQTRIPWTGDDCRGSVVLVDERGDAFAVDRDFRTQEVVVRRISDGVELFHGDGGPGAGNAESSEFKRWLADSIGLEEREQYEDTTCIHQGALIRTQLGEHLLHVATGGHVDVTSARAEIEDHYYTLTQAPLVEGERRRLRERELEQLEREITEVEARLSEARGAQERGLPILSEMESLGRELGLVRDEIVQLEAALPALGERRKAKAERDALSERLAVLEGFQKELQRAQVRLESAEQAATIIGSGPRYPEDFRERLAVMQELWAQRPRLTRELEVGEADAQRVHVLPGAVVAVGVMLGILSIIGGAVLVWSGMTLPGVVLVATGAVVALGLGFWARSGAAKKKTALEATGQISDRLRELEHKIRVKAEGIPDGETLRAETATDRRIRFETEERSQQALDQAKRRLAEALNHMAGELASDGNRSRQEAVSSVLYAPVKAFQTSSTAEVLSEGANQTLDQITRVAATDRNLLASIELELRRLVTQPLPLPPDVPAEAEAVEVRLRERRKQRQELETRLNQLESDLAQSGRPLENPLALEDQVQALRVRWDEVAQQIEIHRRAYALVADAYREFRSLDQERLLGCVSSHLVRITRGSLGPLKTQQGLEGVHVETGGRSLPLESPPLSYGEFHAVLLAVRLGSADFLARSGVRPPFLVDEPFTHLDEDRAGMVWSLLREIAGERQVIVATQDRLILDALGIQPDIILTRRTERVAG